MPLSSGMALLLSYGQMALCICANILVHKVTFTIIFVRTWWSEHRPSDRAGHVSLLPTTQGYLCASVWWTKNISVVVVAMSGFDLWWIQLMSSIKFLEFARTMQRGVHLNKCRLDLMHNGGGIAVAFFTAHARKSTVVHLISRQIIKSVAISN